MFDSQLDNVFIMVHFRMSNCSEREQPIQHYPPFTGNESGLTMRVQCVDL